MASPWIFVAFGLLGMGLAGVILLVLVRAFRAGSPSSGWKKEWVGTTAAVAMVALVILIGAATLHGAAQVAPNPVLGVFGATLANIVAFGFGTRIFGKFPE